MDPDPGQAHLRFIDFLNKYFSLLIIVLLLFCVSFLLNVDKELRDKKSFKNLFFLQIRFEGWQQNMLVCSFWLDPGSQNVANPSDSDPKRCCYLPVFARLDEVAKRLKDEVDIIYLYLRGWMEVEKRLTDEVAVIYLYLRGWMRLRRG